jgi:rod shape-determining protein MreD
MTATVKVPLVVLLVLVLQSSLLSAMTLGVVRPDAMILLPIAAGMVGGPERGAMLGFVSGLVADLFLQTPMGLSALTFATIGFAVGVMHTGVLRSTWWIAPATAAVASGIGVLLFVVVGALVGVTHLIGPDLIWIIIGVALINAPLSMAVNYLMAWAWPIDHAKAFAR